MRDDEAETSSEAPSVVHRTADLRARFGSHWQMDYPGGGVVGVREDIGQGQGAESGDYATVEEAVAEAARIHAERVDRDAALAERILANPRSKLQILAARLGLGRQRGRLLKKVEELRAKVAARGTLGSWSPEVIPLPEEMRGPVLLEQGRPVWLIRAAWPLEEGVRVERLEIRVAEADCFVEFGCEHDIGFRYVAGEGRHALQFKYKAATLANPAVETRVVNHWAFLTREAAVLKVAEVAKRLRETAELAERAMASAEDVR